MLNATHQSVTGGDVEPSAEHLGSESRKFRSACDACHQAKIRCSGGGSPCKKCERDQISCRYSYSARIGKPKGSKNKKTLEKLRMRAGESLVHENQNRNEGQSPRFDIESLPALPTPHSQNSVPSAHLAEPVGVSSATEVSGSGSFSDFQHFETPGDFNSIMNFDIPDSAPFWNHETPMPLPANVQTPFGQLAASLNLASSNSLSIDEANPPLQPHTSADEDDENEWQKLDALNSFAAACVREPFSPASLRSAGMGSTVSSGTSSYGVFSLREPARGHTREAVCVCLRTQADQLCQLRAIEQRQQPIQLDTMLHNSMPVLTSSEKLLQCSICKKDPQVLQLTVMILQIVFRWAESVCHSEHMQCPRFEVRIGDYTESGPESSLVKMVLTSRILGKSRVVLNVLSTTVEHAVTDSSLRLPGYDVDYLRHSSETLMQNLMKIARHIQLPDVRQEANGRSSRSN